MDPALHHVLIAPFHLPFSIFLSGYLESFRLRSSPGVAYCPFPFPLLFSFLELILIPPRASRIYIPLTTPHNPQPTPLHLHGLPVSLPFSDEHGFSFSFVHTLIFHCTLSLPPVLLLLSIACPPSLDISPFYSSSSIGVGIFVHSLRFLYYFTTLCLD